MTFDILGKTSGLHKYNIALNLGLLQNINIDIFGSEMPTSLGIK